MFYVSRYKKQYENDSLIVLRLYGWSTGNGINLLQGFELSFLIRSYSLNVNESLLCSNDDSESLGRPSIRRLLYLIYHEKRCAILFDRYNRWSNLVKLMFYHASLTQIIVKRSATFLRA